MKLVKSILITALLHSCQGDDPNVPDSKINHPAQEKPTEVGSEQFIPIEKDHTFNDISLVIAGINNEREGSYKEISSSSVFKTYNKKIDKSYAKFEQNKLERFKNWSATELADEAKTTENLFYPFSGPDIAYAYAMIPSAKNYFLFGLEPVGEIPSLSGMKGDSLPALFSSINSAISDNLNLSFFITKKHEI
jgi:hypothetical protein